MAKDEFKKGTAARAFRLARELGPVWEKDWLPLSERRSEKRNSRLWTALADMSTDQTIEWARGDLFAAASYVLHYSSITKRRFRLVWEGGILKITRLQ